MNQIVPIFFQIAFNPIALRKAKIAYNLGLCVCNTIKVYGQTFTFLTIFNKGKTFLSFCVLSRPRSPSLMESTLKRKNLLLRSKFFPFRVDHL